jgi:hypothetical protein
MYQLPSFKITDDLRITVGGSEIRLSPAQGLDVAEDLARKSFRRVLAQEAAGAASKPTPKRRSA